MAAAHLAAIAEAWGPNWVAGFPQLKELPDQKLKLFASLPQLYRSVQSASYRVNVDIGMQNQVRVGNFGLTKPLLEKILRSRREEIAANGGELPWEHHDPDPPAGVVVNPLYVATPPDGLTPEKVLTGRQAGITLAAQGLAGLQAQEGAADAVPVLAPNIAGAPRRRLSAARRGPPAAGGRGGGVAAGVGALVGAEGRLIPEEPMGIDGQFASGAAAGAFLPPPFVPDANGLFPRLRVNAAAGNGARQAVGQEVSLAVVVSLGSLVLTAG
jgi:hypothetical protein